MFTIGELRNKKQTIRVSKIFMSIRFSLKNPGVHWKASTKDVIK